MLEYPSGGIDLSASNLPSMYADAIVPAETTYTVAGKEGSIYDLRLGNIVSVTLSGSTITKIEQATESTSSTGFTTSLKDN